MIKPKKGAEDGTKFFKNYPENRVSFHVYPFAWRIRDNNIICFWGRII